MSWSKPRVESAPRAPRRDPFSMRWRLRKLPPARVPAQISSALVHRFGDHAHQLFQRLVVPTRFFVLFLAPVLHGLYSVPPGGNHFGKEIVGWVGGNSMLARGQTGLDCINEALDPAVKPQGHQQSCGPASCQFNEHDRPARCDRAQRSLRNEHRQDRNRRRRGKDREKAGKYTPANSRPRHGRLPGRARPTVCMPSLSSSVYEAWALPASPEGGKTGIRAG